MASESEILTTAPKGAYDVIVVGGGPAGSSSAGLLAKRGRRVLLLEKEKFPRYHIGESLIIGCLGVLEELGLRERVESHGFVRKYGGSLVWGARKERWQFSFIEGGPYTHSYQVRRADFDALLLARARELGVDVREEVTVKQPLRDGDRVIGVCYQDHNGRTHEVKAGFVLDASGQARAIGRQMTTVRWHEDLRNVAIWGYFQGTGTLTGDERGNILIENVPGGWFWGIPLHDNTMSVGYVTAAAEATANGSSLEDLFAEQVANSTELKVLLGDANLVSSMRTARDWSYQCEETAGPGWALVGDAAAFIDPLFSTGVALAMIASTGAASAVDAALAHPADEEKLLRKYSEEYSAFVADILSFVRTFYDQNRDREYYYRQAQAIIDPEQSMSARQGFVRLISGLAGARPIFDLSGDRTR